MRILCSNGFQSFLRGSTKRSRATSNSIKSAETQQKNLSHLVSGARWLSRNRAISSAAFTILRESRDRRESEKVESAPRALRFHCGKWEGNYKTFPDSIGRLWFLP